MCDVDASVSRGTSAKFSYGQGACAEKMISCGAAPPRFSFEDSATTSSTRKSSSHHHAQQSRNGAGLHLDAETGCTGVGGGTGNQIQSTMISPCGIVGQQLRVLPQERHGMKNSPIGARSRPTSGKPHTGGMPRTLTGEGEGIFLEHWVLVGGLVVFDGGFRCTSPFYSSCGKNLGPQEALPFIPW